MPLPAPRFRISGPATNPSFAELAARRRSALNRVCVDLALLAFFFVLGAAPLAWWGFARTFDPFPDYLL